MRMLGFCTALAAGEYAASLLAGYSAAWPALLFLLAIVILFGHGLAVRCWPFAAFFVLGATLFFHGTFALQQKYRECPWMRYCGTSGRGTAAGRSEIARRVKRDLSRRVGVGLEDDRETAALFRAILLGERRSLPYRTKRLFVESGTMHVFAISGLHVMAVSGVLTFLAGLTLVPMRHRVLIVAPVLWGYVYVIGLPPSAVRAAMMATISGFAPLFWRKQSGLRAWTLTFLAVHIWNPLMIVNVGSALSFVVMLAIVLTDGFGDGRASLKKTVFVTLAAWASGVPISAHVFGRVTPGGIVANLVLIATAKVTVVTGAIGVATSYVSDTLAAHVNNLCALGIRSMVLISDCVSRIPYANIETGSWSLAACVGWYVALLFVGFFCLVLGHGKRRL